MSNKSAVVLVSVMVGIAVVAIYLCYQSLDPDYKVIHRMESQITAERGVNAQQLSDESDETIAKARTDRKVTPKAQLMSVLYPSAERAADLGQVEAGWFVRRSGQLRNPPIHFIQGYQPQWLALYSANEDILVVFNRSESVCSGLRGGECTEADGIYKDATPVWMIDGGGKSVMQDRAVGGNADAPFGNYGAALLRICNNGACSTINQLTESYAVAVCGMRSPGTVQGWTNRRTWIGPMNVRQDWYNNTGGFGFNTYYESAPATEACLANPDKAIVRVDLPATK
jgi:hypothetical protein